MLGIVVQAARRRGQEAARGTTSPEERWARLFRAGRQWGAGPGAMCRDRAPAMRPPPPLGGTGGPGGAGRAASGGTVRRGAGPGALGRGPGRCWRRLPELPRAHRPLCPGVPAALLGRSEELEHHLRSSSPVNPAEVSLSAPAALPVLSLGLIADSA